MNSFFDLVIDNFDGHLYIELSQLDEELMYFVSLGGVQPTTIFDENEQKKIVCLCAKIICGATAHYSRVVAQVV